MRALVVEDELRLAELIKRGLERAGYTVELAATGSTGLSAALTGGFDVVVLDAMLPEMDGFEICERLRRAGETVPLLMLTARDSVTDRIRGLDAGADDYLTKPFAFGELTARLRALVRRLPPTPATTLTVGDLVLDTEALTATRAGVQLDLTARELALLEVLMRHAGQVLTRTAIVDEVWDFATNPSSNVVDQYIRYLRRKVDRPFDRSDIETVRGLGYRLRAPSHHVP
ncbi:MAG: response regulator transcription factor [Actinomycetota bacterium]|nr:response regulator transcription factor [Actinomycetota bacterium]